MNTPGSATGASSGLVTGLAWISILGTALFVMIMVAQVGMLAMVVTASGATATDLATFAQLPPIVGVVLDHPFAVTAILLAAGAVIVTISIGLLRRRRWGWWGFTILLAAGALAAIGGLFVDDSFLGLNMLASSADVEDLLLAYRKVSRVAGVVTALAIAAIHVWLIRKLWAPEIRVEFGFD